MLLLFTSSLPLLATATITTLCFIPLLRSSSSYCGCQNSTQPPPSLSSSLRHTLPLALTCELEPGQDRGGFSIAPATSSPATVTHHRRRCCRRSPQPPAFLSLSSARVRVRGFGYEGSREGGRREGGWGVWHWETTKPLPPLLFNSFFFPLFICHKYC